MNRQLISDLTFKNQDYSQNRLPKGEYENCSFEGCNFEQGYLDNQNFMECKFIDCNLSNANLSNTIFKEVTFSHCKMVGLKFEACSNFLLDFNCNDCLLQLSSFYGLPLKNHSFIDCKLTEVDFTKADLRGATFKGSELPRAIFYNTDLRKANFAQASNFTIDPAKNQLKNAKFSKEGLSGLLKEYDLVIV